MYNQAGRWPTPPTSTSTQVLLKKLFSDPNPDGDKTKDFLDFINPNSFQEIEAFVEPSLQGTPPSVSFQFQRLGYFVTDPDTTKDRLVFNKTVGLRDTWAKQNS